LAVAAAAAGAVQISAAVSDIAAMSELAAVQLQLPLGSAAVVTNGRTVIDFNPAAGNGTVAPGMQHAGNANSIALPFGHPSNNDTYLCHRWQ
jgi:hypothetical protein